MNELTNSVSFGQRVITYELVRSSRKTISVQVHPDGTIRVLAPLSTEVGTINNTVKHKAPWIVKQLRFFEQFQPITPPRQYRSGETHRYLGRQYRLKIVEGDNPVVRLIAGFIEVHSPDLTVQRIARMLESWYRQRAEIQFQRILTGVLPQFESYALPEPRLKIKQMPTRWGSCTPAGVIYLHPDLVKAPSSCIEYVLVHEFCHLVHRPHDRAFYSLLERVLPDWQRRKQTLERMMV